MIVNPQLPINNSLCKLNIQGFANTNDASPSGHTVTNSGVTVDSSNIHLYKSSLYFDGSDYLRLADSNDFYLSDNDFCVSLWVRFASFPQVTNMLINQAGTMSGKSFYISVHGTDLYIRGAIVIGGTYYNAQSPNNAISLNTWHHIAFTRSNGYIHMFVDGAGNTPTAVSGSVDNSTGYVGIGCQIWDTTYQNYSNCNIQNAQIIKGRAVYTSDFKPPKVIM